MNKVKCKCNQYRRVNKAMNGNSIESDLNSSKKKKKRDWKHTNLALRKQNLMKKEGSWQSGFPFKSVNSALDRYTVYTPKYRFLLRTITQTLELELMSLENQEKPKFIYISLQMQLEKERSVIPWTECSLRCNQQTNKQTILDLLDGLITAAIIPKSFLSFLKIQPMDNVKRSNLIHILKVESLMINKKLIFPHHSRLMVNIQSVSVELN